MLLLLFRKFLGKHQTHSEESNAPVETIEERIARIQQGDFDLRNTLITEYQPFIAKAVSRFCKRYIDPSRDDEYSIALMAFNEAINQFSEVHGRSFLGFAETVIRRRLIDLIRKEQRFAQQVPYSAFDGVDEDDNQLNPVETHQAIEHYEKQNAGEERKHEIAELTASLKEYGITFLDLVENSPKHTDSRQMFFRIGRLLAEDVKISSILIHKKTLPIKELLEQVQVSRKTLERNRKYIIAISIIFRGNYPYLRDYLHIPYTEEGGGQHE